MIFCSNNTEMLQQKKKATSKKFQVEKLEETQHILGIRIKWRRESRTPSITQKKYLDGALKKFNQEN